jgi:5'/3'-nucleotidase
MRILLTNDDGILAPGLVAIYRELVQMGDVTIVAPTTPQSAVGHAISVSQPLFTQEIDVAEGVRGHSVDGRPADCVKLAILELMQDALPDLVVSGINHGENVGINVLYSGTVAAAIEGAFYGLPSVALSLAFSEHMDFRGAARLGRTLIEQLLDRSAGSPLLANVNMPDLSGGPGRGVRVCRMGVRITEEAMVQRHDPRGRPYYWITGGFVPTGNPHPESDQVALAEGYVTITPLAFDLTDEARLDAMKSWDVTLPGD